MNNMNIDSKNSFTVLENGMPRTFTYEEVLTYHGGEMPGGVALAFRMLQWVFNNVLKTIPEKGQCGFYSGLGENGRGIIDTTTLLLGVKAHESLRLDKSYSLDKTGPVAPGGGRYYFECSYGDTLVQLAVKDGAIPEEFFRYSFEMHRKRNAGEPISEAETAHLQKLRQELSFDILAAEGKDLFILL